MINMQTEAMNYQPSPAPQKYTNSPEKITHLMYFSNRMFMVVIFIDSESVTSVLMSNSSLFKKYR